MQPNYRIYATLLILIPTSITLIAMSYMSVIMGGVRIHHVRKKSSGRSSFKN